MTHKVDAVAEGKRFALTKKFGATVYNGWANSGEYECYCRRSIRKRLLGFHHGAERCHHISQRHQPECAASPRQKVKDYCEQSHYYPDDKYWLAWCMSF